MFTLLVLQGPEIRTGTLKDGKPVQLTTGQVQEGWRAGEGQQSREGQGRARGLGTTQKGRWKQLTTIKAGWDAQLSR